MLNPWTRNFLELAQAYEALKFGSFTLKSGRISPYFFNAGLFSDGQGLDGLARCYAQALTASHLGFDQLFGPAYKGIPLAAAVALSLHRDHGQNVPFIYNRKEAKDHGEGGQLVGPPLSGRVVIIDDVISAGTSVNESIAWIRQAGAEPVGVLIALDRQERGPDERSAVQSFIDQGLSVISIARLDDLIVWLEESSGEALAAVREYRDTWGVQTTSD